MNTLSAICNVNANKIGKYFYYNDKLNFGIIKEAAQGN